jgi:hypothetical protein
MVLTGGYRFLRLNIHRLATSLIRPQTPAGDSHASGTVPMHDQFALGCEVVHEVDVHPHQCGDFFDGEFWFSFEWWSFNFTFVRPHQTLEHRERDSKRNGR